MKRGCGIAENLGLPSVETNAHCLVNSEGNRYLSARTNEDSILIVTMLGEFLNLLLEGKKSMRYQESNIDQWLFI